MSEDTVLVAGTLVEHQKPDGSWARIPSITSTGATGETAEPKEKTTVGDKIKRYGTGLQEAPDKSFKMQVIPKQVAGDTYYQDYLLQQDFINRAKAKEAMQMRVTWPDLERATMAVQVLGYEVDDATAEDWKMATISAKQNSVTGWSESPTLTGISVTGDSGGALAPAGTEQLTVAPLPADAWYQADKTYASDDTAVATVSEGGVVTGVAAGTANITVTMSGQTETYAVTVS